MIAAVRRKAVNKLWFFGKNPKARTIVLPSLLLLQVADEKRDDCVRIEIKVGKDSEEYFFCEVGEDNGRDSNFSDSVNINSYNRFPVVVDRDGIPWPEANLYLISKLEENFGAADNLSKIATDLSHFLEFINFRNLDWLSFDLNKLKRPTYRFRGFLWSEVQSGKLAHSTFNRRIGSVIGMYKWLIDSNLLRCQYPPWVTTDNYIPLEGVHGNTIIKKVESNDLTKPIPKSAEPLSGLIEDGGKLRPLPHEEQRWLLEALDAYAHPELTLIHIFAIVTGGRIQTLLTFKVRHVLDDIKLVAGSGEVRVSAGPGTGIDTKDDKKIVLHIPLWFYEKLGMYANSQRARTRRQRAKGGDHSDQYLFLSQNGNPFYESKIDLAQFNPNNKLRHSKSGQSLRQLIRENIIPFIKLKHDTPFHYRPHDLRATFGLNITDEQLERVKRKEISLSAARDFVRLRMNHESSETTDRYLNYRSNMKYIRDTNNQYGTHLIEMTNRVLKEGL